MTTLNWGSIADQLRAIGINVPAHLSGHAAESASVTTLSPFAEPPQTRTPNVEPCPRIDRDDPPAGPPADVISSILKSARTAGVSFFERVADGALVADGLSELDPDTRKAVQVHWDAICSALLPPLTSTASLTLLNDLGVELVVVETETHAVELVERICASASTLGLDLETAPRPEFLPVQAPIMITSDGLRSKFQPPMDASAGLDPFRAEVRLLQVAAEFEGRLVALVFDLRRVPITSSALKPLWRCRIVGHNLSFDAKMLLASGIVIPDENIVDTILMSGLVLRGQPDKRREGSRRPSLADAVKEALGLTLPKTSQLSPWWRDRLTDEQVAYAALDPVMALKLASVLQPRIDKLKPGPDGQSLCDRLCRAVMPVARMELGGVSFDQNALTQQVEAWEIELTDLSADVAKLGISNPSSGPQVAAWLRRELERLDAETGFNWLKDWPQTPTGALSTKAKHIRRLIETVPEAGVLVKNSQFTQLRSNFGGKLIERISPHTSRLHSSFLIGMAKSGRFSSSKPNLQNIPNSREMRSLFVAPPGRMLVVADYSQLELRVMAEIAKDEVMSEAYRNGLDLHAMTAAGLLGIAPGAFDPDDPTHKGARQKAKAVNFGVIFGSGPRGLKELARDTYGVVMNDDEAQSLIDRFLATYPGVARWQRAQADRSLRLGRMSTVGGRIYRFQWEAREKYARNLALNLPVQGTAAEIAVEAVIRIDRRLRTELPGRAQLVLQIHDEFVVEVAEDECGVEAAKAALKEEMVASFGALLPGAPTTGLVDAHSGKNWAEAKM